MDRTALHWAAEVGLADAVPALLAAGDAARAELLKQHREDEEAAAAALADAGAPEGAGLPELPPPPALVELPDTHGDLALHLAARGDHVDVVAALVNARGDGWDGGAPAVAAATNKARDTPLHAAAARGAAAAAAALLAAAPGAAGAANKHGFTPAALAARRGHAALAKLLAPEGAPRVAPAGLPPGAPPLAPPGRPTLLLAPPECLAHYTSPQPVPRGGPEPPPENTQRLRVLTEVGIGSLRAAEFEGRIEWGGRVEPAALTDILRVHEWNYIRNLKVGRADFLRAPDGIGWVDRGGGRCGRQQGRRRRRSPQQGPAVRRPGPARLPSVSPPPPGRVRAHPRLPICHRPPRRRHRHQPRHL
jgi:hypothetical protein